jgi:hypothetical protein
MSLIPCAFVLHFVWVESEWVALISKSLFAGGICEGAMGLEVPLERLNATATATLADVRAAARVHGRDPRAAPHSMRKNISIVETCRFYGVADALTSCRVPRSCRDCLAMPVRTLYRHQ